METITDQKIKTENLNFGEAIELLKRGQALQRNGWNGKGMYLFLNKGSQSDYDANAKTRWIDGVPIDLFEKGDEGTITRLPNINMRTASGSIVTGWLASQTDMLAEDWQCLPQTA